MDIINYSKVKKLEEKVNTNKAEVTSFKEDYANLEGINKGAVTPKKASFIKVSTNLIDKTKLIKGYNISTVTGELTASGVASVTNFLPILPIYYRTSSASTRAFYDINKVFISGVAGNGEFLIPSNAVFIRISTTVPDDVFFYEGRTVLTYESYYKPYIVGVEVDDIKDRAVNNMKIGYDEVDKEHLHIITPSSNLLDNTTLVQGFTLSAGLPVVSSTNSISGFNKIKPNTIYTGILARWCQYDEDENYIPGATGTTKTFTTLSNAAFVKLVIYITNIPVAQLNEGDVLLPYEEFYSTFSRDSGLSNLNQIIEDGTLKIDDRYMIDLPVNDVFSTNEVYTDVSSTWGTSTHAEVYALFDQLVTDYPSYITKELLGNQSTGLPVYLYKFIPILPTTGSTVKVPKIFITCGVHGNEKASTLSTYLMLKQMCEKWQDYSLLEAIKHNVNMLIIPIGNPYGWDNFTRKNANLVDINRNFPIDWKQRVIDDTTYGGTAPLSELESQYIKSVFDNNPDIDIMYDFHNFHGTAETTTNFIWIPFANTYTQHMAQNLISRLTRKWRKEYTFIPDEPYFVGTTEGGSGGTIATYAYSVGAKFAGVLEICWRWHLDTTGANYDTTVCKTGVETLANWLLINLRELIK